MRSTILGLPALLLLSATRPAFASDLPRIDLAWESFPAEMSGAKLTGTATMADTQLEYRAILVGRDYDDVVYLREDDVPGGLVTILGFLDPTDGGYSVARGASETGTFDVPLSRLDAPASTPVTMFAPAVFSFRSESVEDLLIRMNVERFTFTAILQKAVGMIFDDWVPIDFEDIACETEGGCCESIADTFEAVIEGVLEDPPTTLGDVKDALLDALDTVLRAGLSEPGDPGDPGWLATCFAASYDSATLEDALERIDLAIDLGEIALMGWAVAVGPGTAETTVNVCELAGCPGACEVLGEGITCTSCASDAECDDGDACNGTETCEDAVCTAGVDVSCEWDEACEAGACVAREPEIYLSPTSVDLANCAAQGGRHFEPGSTVTAVFADLVSGTEARESWSVDDEGEIATAFGLECGDVDAEADAESFLDRVDPWRLGFSGRSMQMTVEYWADGSLHETDAIDYDISYAGSGCVPTCGTAECGDDGCGGSCGSCTGTDACDVDTCVATGATVLSVSGTLTGSHHWTTASSPIHVTGDITLTGTLLIDAGVVVEFADKADLLVTTGTLDVAGTASSPVVFTSDGEVVAESWGGVRVDATAGDCTLDHLELRYGGEDSAVDYPLLVDARRVPTIDGLTFFSDNIAGVALKTGSYAGDVTLTDPGVPYWIEDDITINAGVTLTVGPGVVLKLADENDDLWIEGRVELRGSSSRPVVITAGSDDDAGGDTDADGSWGPTAGSWGGMQLAYGSGLDESVFEHVEIRYAGSGSAYDLDWPLDVDPRVNPTFDDLELVGNSVDAIHLQSDDAWAWDVTLDQTAYPYWITSDITINPGVTVDVEPGVVVKFDDENDDVWVGGRLRANGTDDHPIIFTSGADDSAGGDSDGGGSSAGAEGDWGGISFEADTLLADSQLDHVSVRFGGSGSAYDLDYPILIDGRVNPSFDHLELRDNSVDCFALVADTYTEDVHLDQTAYPYWIENDLGVSEGTTLTLDPGVILKFADENDDLRIDGRLVALGTAAAPIIFTSGADDTAEGSGDSAGGDSDGGGSSIGAAGDWGGIYFDDDTLLAPSELDQVEIRYGASGSTYDLAYPILLDANQNPVFGELTLRDNLVDAIAIDTGTYTYDVLLDQTAAAYWIEDDVTIASGVTLTIDPGVILKFADANDDLVVEGRLDAIGTAADPIVLTSQNDDSAWDPAAEGDADAGGSSTGAAKDWAGVEVDGSATLDHVEIRYAGSGSTYDSDCALEVYGSVVAASTRFVSNDDAVCIRSGTADLGGGSLGSAGGNTFSGHTAASGSWAVYNATTSNHYARGNTWGTTDIAGVIYDHADSSSLGTVYWNTSPVAESGSLVTDEDVAAAITLAASDAEGSSLTWTTRSGPSHGSLSGTAPALTYTPTTNYHGTDSFTFSVSDGTDSSATATISIVVNPVNDTPTASDRSATTAEDSPVVVTLSGSDADGDTLTWSVASAPGAGAASVSGSALTYTPDPDWNGTDTLTVVASDGAATSTPATVRVTVTAVDDAPEAAGGSFVTDEDQPVAVAAVGADIDSTSLSWVVETGPANGTLTGTGPDWIYTPAADYAGTDRFAVHVSDGSASSAPVWIDLVINPVNDAPALADLALSTTTDTPVSGVVVGVDVDGDPLVWSVASTPGHGVVTGSLPTVIYTPEAGFEGSDSFVVEASDGAESTTATVSVSVSSAGPPVADDQAIDGDEDTPLDLELTGFDPQGDALVYTIVAVPEHGTLTGTAPLLTYTPDTDWNGTDTLRFEVTDGADVSLPATVTLEIRPVDDPPACVDAALSTPYETPIAVTLEAVDPDGDAVTYGVIGFPASGSLSGAPPTVTYTPSAGFSGVDSFQWSATAGGRLATATVQITVLPPNRAPVFVDPTPVGPLTATEGSELGFTVAATDDDGTVPVLGVPDAPSGASFDSSSGAFTWTPTWSDAGTRTLTLEATDGIATSTRSVDVIVSWLDGDADGLADTWEASVGLDPLRDDSDGDGLSDADEWAVEGDTDGDGLPAALDPDADGDGVDDGVDVCPEAADADQADTDGDGVGDACDEDMVDTGTVDTGSGETGDTGTVDTGTGETGSGETGDSGTVDTGTGETGSGETGSGETGDSGTVDTGTGDSGDSGAVDTGTGETGDSGAVDTGTGDSGDSDLGGAPGSTDTERDTGKAGSTGCGCASTRGSSWLGAVVVAFGLARRRARAR